MVGRQVEFAASARDDGAAADAAEPFIVAQVLACLALHGRQIAVGFFDVGEDLLECRGVDGRVVAKGQQRMTLAVKFLQQVALEVGTAGDIENLEQGDQRRMMGARVGRRQKIVEPLEQVFEAQECAHAFVERIFVKDQWMSVGGVVGVDHAKNRIMTRTGPLVAPV